MIFLESSNTECAGKFLRTRMRFRRMFILSPLRDCTFSHSLGHEPPRHIARGAAEVHPKADAPVVRHRGG